MALAEIVTYTLVGGGGSAAIASGMVLLSNLKDKIKQKKIAEKHEAEKTDGRTPGEWYEIIKGLGREEYERLSRGALDGLEESDKYGKWDIKPLLKDYYDLLMQDWYPEKYCKYCRKQNCKQKCDAYWAGVPRCKLCYDYVEHGRCVSCGTSAFGTIRTKSERAKEVDVTIDELLGAIKITPKSKGRKNYIAIMNVAIQGTDHRGYRVVRNNENWLIGTAEIGAFQTYKGLQPTGVIDEQTKDVLVRYLDAGNPFPVQMPGPVKKNLTVSELEQVQRDLAKWKAWKKELDYHEKRLSYFDAVTEKGYYLD